MEREEDRTRAVQHAIDALSVRRDGDGWSGEMPADMWGATVFGGFVIAHAVVAATRDAPRGRRLHSLHAYFLRPVVSGQPINYQVVTLRDGRTLASRRLDATQDGKPVLSMLCSFGADRDGYEYQATVPDDVPDPRELPTESLGPWQCAVIGPSEADANGFRRSTHRMWFRTASPLPDDEQLAAAFIAFATDLTWKGARPLRLDGDTRGIVSVDHSVWFHRTMRPDDWCYYDVHALINAGGRGLVRGQMFSADRQLCVSVAQETLLTRFEDAPPR